MISKCGNYIPAVKKVIFVFKFERELQTWCCTLNLALFVIILLGQGSGWGMTNILAPKWGMTEKV